MKMILKIHIIEYKCIWSGERQTKNLQSGIRRHSWSNEKSNRKRRKILPKKPGRKNIQDEKGQHQYVPVFEKKTEFHSLVNFINPAIK